MRTVIQCIVVLSLLVPLCGFALSPASPEQIFGISTCVVVGTVLKATAKEGQIKKELVGGGFRTVTVRQDVVNLEVEIS
ncbi:MAG: hypothetical protein HGB11_13370 [Chlorobiales bacterium]|nr:hypothetical protein [Chlorobiales bacterium]